MTQHLAHDLGIDDPGDVGGAAHAPGRAARPRGTDRPPARYSELGSSCPTACSVTRAAARTASRSRPGAHAGLLQHVDQLLGGDVAAGARGERAAAEAADGGVQLGHPRLDRGQRVGLPGAAGVVEVHAHRDARAGPADGVQQLHDPQRRRRPDGVAEAQLVGAGGHRGAGDVDRAGDRGAAVERAVPGGGDDDLERAAGAVRQPRRSRRRPPTASAVDRPALARLCPSVADTTYSRFATPASTARTAPRALATSADQNTPPQRDSSAATWSASASAGTAFGETKDVASIRRTPVATSASSISSLAVQRDGRLQLQAVAHADLADVDRRRQHQVELVHARASSSVTVSSASCTPARSPDGATRNGSVTCGASIGVGVPQDEPSDEPGAAHGRRTEGGSA